MREVVFKELSPVYSRKKDIFLKEVFEKDGVWPIRREGVFIL